MSGEYLKASTQTPLECVAVWAAQLRTRGFDDRIRAEHWFGEWKDRKHLVVNGADGSILEITHANVYTRVVADQHAPVDKPFAFYRYVSSENAERPKTDFHLDALAETYLSREEVSALLAGYLF